MELLINLCYALIMAGFIMVSYLGMRAFLRMQRDYNTVKAALERNATQVTIKGVRITLERNSDIIVGNRRYTHCGPYVEDIHKDIVHTAVMLSAGKPIRYFKEYSNA